MCASYIYIGTGSRRVALPECMNRGHSRNLSSDNAWLDVVGSLSVDKAWSVQE